MAETPEQLPCVLIPVEDQTLLLPNVSIAEIVDYAELQPDSSERDWLLGWFQWRGTHLPVLSWEAANGRAAVLPDGQRGRILVLNTITEAHRQNPFMALATQGIPRQARVTPSELERKEGDEGQAELMTVTYEGEAVCIPDLSELEGLLAQAAQG